MADRNLKIIPATEAKATPDIAPAATPVADKPAAAPRASRKRLRFTLLVALPVLAALAGAGIYFTGGRYISTDNSYVGAQKVLITPDISGKVARIAVREGQHVNAGDALLVIDDLPFRLALTQAQAKLAGTETDLNNLKSNYKSLNRLSELAEQNIAIKQRDVDRRAKLVSTQSGSQADLDVAGAAMVSAQLQAQLSVQQRDSTFNQLLRNPDLPLAQFPSFMQAKAALDQAQRDLDHTVIKAPIAGTATQVDNIQLGRFVAAGGPILSVIDDSAPWVDANPKETDITYLRVGQEATVEVDTFPGHVFKGRVAAVSPGTGSQFSILPAQNASGNWVKVVQRVPVRVVFDQGEDTKLLRIGMSANVEIDTGHSRMPFGAQTKSAGQAGSVTVAKEAAQ